MASKKQVQANRANAMKSTGPKTAHGKKRIGRNAMKHGFYAEKCSLIWKDEAALRADVFEQRQPKGAMEKDLADQIVTNLLTLRQCDIATERHLADLGARAAAERVYEVEISAVEIGGSLQMFEEVKEQMLLEAGTNIELTEADIQNALRMSVADVEAMKVTALINRMRNSAWRDIKHCEEQLASTQDIRRAREKREEDERFIQELEKEAEDERKNPPRFAPRLPVQIGEDGN
jgi:hypothetical protein